MMHHSKRSFHKLRHWEQVFQENPKWCYRRTSFCDDPFCLCEGLALLYIRETILEQCYQFNPGRTCSQNVILARLLLSVSPLRLIWNWRY